MSAQHSGRSRRHREDEEPTDVPDQPKKEKSDNQVSAATDDLLDDIDRALKEGLGFDEDEEVSDDEYEERVDSFVKSYVQKGGQ